MFQHVYLYADGSRRIASTDEARLLDQDQDRYIQTTFSHMEFQTHAWPGGYELYYICNDGGILCHHCANKEFRLTADEQGERCWSIVGCFINYEAYNVYCDHCGRQIKPAYGDES